MGCLDGVRGIELAGMGPGPFCTSLLVDHGADVVRVVRPNGAELAGLGSASEPMTGGRREIEIDIKRDGPDQLLDLVMDADFLIEGFRPGVMERLGVGPAQCLARNDRLVYARITGWGQEGPLAQRAGHDIDYIAITGALAAIGDERGPVPPINLVGDYAGGGLFAAFGILAALLERERSGRGQVVDAAMVDGAGYLMAPFFELMHGGGWSSRRADNVLDGHAPFYATYATSDGRWLAVGALEPHFFETLRDALTLGDEPSLGSQYDRATWPEMRRCISDRIASASLDHWLDRFDGLDACVAPVLDLREAPHHPHQRARAAHLDRDGRWHPDVAPRFSRSPGRRRSISPAVVSS